MITLHNSLEFPEGKTLDFRTEVRFTPDPARPEQYVEFYLPQTRDQGWIQVTTSPFHSILVSQHSSGLYLRAASYSEIHRPGRGPNHGGERV